MAGEAKVEVCDRRDERIRRDYEAVIESMQREIDRLNRDLYLRRKEVDLLLNELEKCSVNF